MDPVFTLQWQEFLVAQELQKLFPKSKHYSVLVPGSRQEKGIDLALVRKQPEAKSRVALIQVKASRTYSPEAPKRQTTRRFRFYTWFNRFDPSPDADFFFLVGMYAPDSARTKPVNAPWYKHCTLMFPLAEMQELMASCVTVGGRPDGKFGFGFDTEAKIVQTRGDQRRQYRDYTDHLLHRSAALLRAHLET
jgi:hypothetical protein